MLKLIACNVFMREAAWCITSSPHVVDVEFTELGEHSRPENLRAILQSRIDAVEASGKKYDAVMLLFGLCGNSTVGLQARSTQLVIPRAHDCCTILLGSRQKFVEHFGDNPSTPFSSAGYLERGEYFLRTNDDGSLSVQSGGGGDTLKAYIEQYGEEDGRFIYEQMHPQTQGDHKAVFIDLPQTRHLGYAGQFLAKASAAGKESVRLDGDIRLIENLIHGKWDPQEYLTVPPGGKIAGVYDHQEIMRADR